MSLAAALAVRQSIYQALLSDSSVLNKKGSNAIFDEAPGKVDPPYIAFGPIVSRDWSTAQEKGDEHDFTLHCWSMQPGTRQALDLAGDVIRILDHAPLQLESHHLVLIAYTGLETRRENKGRYALAAVRFKILTEREL